MLRIAATEGSDLRLWTKRVAAMRASGELSLIRSEGDTMLAGRIHDRLRQHHQSVPVWGGELVVQRAGDKVLSVFGAIYDGIDIAVKPSIRVADAEAAAKAFAGREATIKERAQLIVYPHDARGYVLAYLMRTRTIADDLAVFVDARSGEVVAHVSERMSRR